MSRFKKGRNFPGADMSWDTEGGGGGEADGAPTPLYPAYVVPFARKPSPQEQSQVDWGRHFRERLREGPFFSVLDVTSTSAKKGTAARANFDPFNGMPSFSSRYQKKRRTMPKIDPNEREWVMRYFPRDSWTIIQPEFRPDMNLVDGYKPQPSRAGKRGFEDDEDQAAENATKERGAGEGDEDSGPEEEVEGGEILDAEEDEEEEVVDDDFEDDEDDMGGDYNAEQYFDGGDEDFGDDDGGGGDEDTY